MVLSKKRMTKALIRLRVWAGWSAPVLFATPPKTVFSRRGPYCAWVKVRNFQNYQILKLAVGLQISMISSSNGQLPLDELK